jgi:uncharacterized membrane protein
VNISRDPPFNQPESTATWIIVLARLGRLLFSLAIIFIGAQTLICSYVANQSTGPHYRVVPVIPWLPAIPILAYSAGIIFILCGLGLFFKRTLLVSGVIVGLVMSLAGLAFDVPRHPDVMSAPWRTNVLEPIVIGSMAWLVPGVGRIPGWLNRAGRYLLALSLIVFGIAHFQILGPIASMVPGWIPWHRFWTVFFGLAFMAAGISFATGFRQRAAAIGLGLMFALWLITIHLPPVLNYLRNPGVIQDPDKWSDVFIVAALWGGSWALVRGLGERRAASRPANSNSA